MSRVTPLLALQERPIHAGVARWWKRELRFESDKPQQQQEQWKGTRRRPTATRVGWAQNEDRTLQEKQKHKSIFCDK